MGSQEILDPPKMAPISFELPLKEHLRVTVPPNDSGLLKQLPMGALVFHIDLQREYHSVVCLGGSVGYQQCLNFTGKGVYPVTY